MNKQSMGLNTIDSSLLEGFLDWLHPIRTLANKECNTIYIKLVFFFEQRDCDPGVCVFETIVRIAKLLKQKSSSIMNGENIIENKRGYIYGVAKNVCHEFLRAEKNAVSEIPPEYSLPEPLTVQPDIIEDEKTEDVIIQQTKRKLAFQMLGQCQPGEWSLIRDYVGVKKSENQSGKLAKRHGITVNNLRVRVSRGKNYLNAQYHGYLKELSKSFDR
jgi:DNA-directed RNA polymerase specialized sigma24 family protein